MNEAGIGGKAPGCSSTGFVNEDGRMLALLGKRACAEAGRREAGETGNRDGWRDRTVGAGRLVGVRELLAFPVAFLPGLLPCTVHMRSAQGTCFAFTTSRGGFARAKGSNVPVFVGGEYRLLALAAENDRASEDDLESYLRRKLRNASWRLMFDVCGWQPQPRAPKWTFADLCRELDIWIECVEVG